MIVMHLSIVIPHCVGIVRRETAAVDFSCDAVIPADACTRRHTDNLMAAPSVRLTTYKQSIRVTAKIHLRNVVGKIGCEDGDDWKISSIGVH